MQQMGEVEVYTRYTIEHHNERLIGV